MLVQHGKPSSIPVALVRRVSWPDQQVIRCTLGTVTQTLAQLRSFRPPVIAIVGEVAGAPLEMDWFANRPLFGKRFLITSPEATASKLASFIRDEGGIGIIEPAMTIKPPDSWTLMDEAIGNWINSTGWFSRVLMASMDCYNEYGIEDSMRGRFLIVA